MYKIEYVRALERYRLELTFSDGAHGVVDLADLAGHGLFALWDDYEQFLRVRIGDTGELVWSDQVDLCADSVYLRLTGKRPEEVFPDLSRELVHA